MKGLSDKTNQQLSLDLGTHTTESINESFSEPSPALTETLSLSPQSISSVGQWTSTNGGSRDESTSPSNSGDRALGNDSELEDGEIKPSQAGSSIDNVNQEGLTNPQVIAFRDLINKLRTHKTLDASLVEFMSNVNPEQFFSYCIAFYDDANLIQTYLDKYSRILRFRNNDKSANNTINGLKDVFDGFREYLRLQFVLDAGEIKFDANSAEIGAVYLVSEREETLDPSLIMAAKNDPKYTRTGVCRPSNGLVGVPLHMKTTENVLCTPKVRACVVVGKHRGYAHVLPATSRSGRGTSGIEDESREDWISIKRSDYEIRNPDEPFEPQSAHAPVIVSVSHASNVFSPKLICNLGHFKIVWNGFSVRKIGQLDPKDAHRLAKLFTEKFIEILSENYISLVPKDHVDEAATSLKAGITTRIDGILLQSRAAGGKSSATNIETQGGTEGAPSPFQDMDGDSTQSANSVVSGLNPLETGPDYGDDFGRNRNSGDHGQGQAIENFYREGLNTPEGQRLVRLNKDQRRPTRGTTDNRARRGVRKDVNASKRTAGYKSDPKNSGPGGNRSSNTVRGRGRGQGQGRART